MALPTCGRIRRVTTHRLLAQCVLYTCPVTTQIFLAQCVLYTCHVTTQIFLAQCHVTTPCSKALQSAAFNKCFVAFPAESVTLGCQTFLRLKGYPKTNPSCFHPPYHCQGECGESPGTCSSPLSARDDGRVEIELEIGRLKGLPCVELTRAAAWLCPLPADPLSKPKHYHLPHKPSKNSCIVGEVPVQAVKAYGGSTGIAPHILNVSTTWR